MKPMGRCQSAGDQSPACKQDGKWAPQPGQQVPEALMCVGWQYDEGGLTVLRNAQLAKKRKANKSLRYPAGLKGKWSNGVYWSAGESFMAYERGKFPLVIGFKTEAFSVFTCNKFDVMFDIESWSSTLYRRR